MLADFYATADRIQLFNTVVPTILLIIQLAQTTAVHMTACTVCQLLVRQLIR